MLWEDIPSTLRAVYGAITGASEARMSTAEVWASTRAAAAARGLSSEGWTIQHMNFMRQASVGVRTGEELLNDAIKNVSETGIDQALSADMIGAHAYAPPLSSEMVEREYTIRFRTDVVKAVSPAAAGVEQEVEQIWHTVTIDQLPGTVSALTQQIDDARSAFLDKYGLQDQGNYYYQVTRTR